MNKTKHKNGLLALSPLAVFLVIYLLSSLIGGFGEVPIGSVFLLACIYSVLIARRPGGEKYTLSERLETFSRGAGDHNILLMVWIFILAGAFAGTAKDMGSVDSTVNAMLSIIPGNMLYAGLFLTACFISMAIGTSVGTITALVPLAAGIAVKCGSSVGFMTAIIVGGAFFGDNLSFISDTTIAATRVAGCRMKDKFLTNISIIAPAVVIVTAIYIIMGREVSQTIPTGEINWLKLTPYLLVIYLALRGKNVTTVLSIGIAANAIIGFCTGAFTWNSWLTSAGGGITGMGELIIVTMLAGGLLEMIRDGGGLEYLIDLMTRRISGPKGAQASIAGLVALANLCTANNTIAIITTGGIAHRIATKFGIDPRKTASILDTFSCLVQGLIPYGAQVLMAVGIANKYAQVSPADIIPSLYYPFIMGLCAILAIVFDLPRRTRSASSASAKR